MENTDADGSAMTARHFVRQSDDEYAKREKMIPAKERRKYGQLVTSLILLVLLGLFISSQANNPNMNWSVTAEFMFHPVILSGIQVTLALAVVAMLLSIVIAFGIALMIQSRNKVASWAGRVYVWFFRGVPALVQVLLWYNLAVLFPTIFGFDTNTLISGFTAGLIALTLAESGYMAEIIRGGIISVPPGQSDAGISLGLTRNETLRRIVLPQTIRVIIPPTGNQFIGMLKATSLVAFIGGSDLLTRVQLIYGQNFKILPLLIVAVLWYLILVTVASIGQHYLEQYLNASQPGARQARKKARHSKNVPASVESEGSAL
ncbi:amino acid ABC transporter permease [uncultured Nitratireductor sp.]|uniref:amino acid ABC transporter permease n=1 Tax=uncultured Nitratireductor sp. TaxID=520953 RepID=UPI00262A83F1|nr:amino acid ABC transporter permease [uncultured Nitratireductor sp.]